MKRKIAVITGTRAEYGLLYWLMKEIQADEQLELQVVATGMHLAPEFGWTYRIIEEDGFTIDAKVDMLLASDTPVAVTKSIGLATIGFADVFDRLRPDIVVVLGDRYEILAAAQAALVARIPLAHVHGGEATEGVIDEAIRHSVTKMAHLHFVAAEAYRQRIIQLGEHPSRVFNFGAPGLEYIRRVKLLSRNELEAELGIVLRKPLFLVTLHPVTLSRVSPAIVMEELFAALDMFPEASIVLTKTNSDPNGRIINELIDDYVRTHPKRAVAFESLGQLRYLSVMNEADVVIGNSSSGLIEAPALKKPTVNIGPRQHGRLRASSVIDCAESREAIVRSVRKALSEEFRSTLDGVVSPYGSGDVAARIKEVLKTFDLDGILMKQFYDVKFSLGEE